MSSHPAPQPLSIDALQTLERDGFVTLLGGVVEHSPWVVQRAWAKRPFNSFEALFEVLSGCIHDAAPAEQVALVRVHPELAGREAVAGTMTPDSNAEQGRLGLLALSPQDMARLTDLNRRYQAKFGFPFVVALRLHASLASVFQAFEARLAHDAGTELTIALQQVCEVMRGRLARAVADNNATPTPLSPSPSLSTAPRNLP